MILKRTLSYNKEKFSKKSGKGKRNAEIRSERN